MLLVVVLVVVVVSGYVAFVVLAFTPAAYLSARWVAAAPAVMLEQQSPIAALRRSWALSKSNIWRCLGFVILLTLFSSLVIGLPLSVAQQVATILMPTQFALIAMVGAIAGYLASILYQPIYATGMAMLYYDLRVRVPKPTISRCGSPRWKRKSPRMAPLRSLGAFTLLMGVWLWVAMTPGVAAQSLQRTLTLAEYQVELGRAFDPVGAGGRG